MGTTHLQSIGGCIKSAREMKGWTQQKLSEQAGLRQATIADIELGKSNFEINTLVRIAGALGFAIDINFVQLK